MAEFVVDSEIIEISDMESSSESVIEVSSDEYSDDNSTESLSELVFVDLESYEIVTVTGHTAPKATAEELQRISEKFVEAVHTETEDSDKVLNYSNVTIRKRYRFRALSVEDTAIPASPEKPLEPLEPKQIQQTHGKKSFLESLDDKVTLDDAHPDALKFKKNFKKHRNDLVDKLIALYNEKLFDNKLQNIPYTWTKSIGTCSGSYDKGDTVTKSQSSNCH